MLNAEQKFFLLTVARAAIAAQWPQPGTGAVVGESPLATAAAYHGAFVSLHLHGKLRGCVGALKDVTDLVDTIRHTARAAAFQDPRFSPLAEDELSQAQLEISLLHPLQPLRAPEEIVIGKDGLMIRLEQKHGLLLPQVAGKRGWDAHKFLQHLCRKADLPLETWQDPQAELFRFRAEVFSDPEFS